MPSVPRGCMATCHASMIRKAESVVLGTVTVDYIKEAVPDAFKKIRRRCALPRQLVLEILGSI
jgi:hypothetical protein